MDFRYFPTINADITNLTIDGMTLGIMYEANSMLPNLNKLTINEISNNPNIFNLGDIRMNNVKDLSIIAFDYDKFPNTIFFDKVESLRLIVKSTNERNGIFSDEWLNFLIKQVGSTLINLDIFVNVLLDSDIEVMFNKFPKLQTMEFISTSDMNRITEYARKN